MKMPEMTLIFIFSFYGTVAAACPENMACRKITLSIDLKSDLELGEVHPAQFCQSARDCEPTNEYLSSDTDGNCDAKIEFTGLEGEKTGVAVKSEKMREFISLRFSRNVHGFEKKLPLGHYNIRRKFKVDDLYACVPVDKARKKLVNVYPLQKPSHCSGKSSPDSASSYQNEFVTRSTLCRGASLGVLDTELEGTVCGEAKSELKRMFNEKIRSTANQVAAQIMRPSPASLPVSGDAGESLNSMIAQYGTLNPAYYADGVGLVTALKVHKELSDRLKEPCDTTVCVKCK